MPTPLDDAQCTSSLNDDDLGLLLLGHVWGICTLADPRSQRLDIEAIRRAWDQVGDQLVEAWRHVYPCTRPFGWWLVGEHQRKFLGQPERLAEGYRPNMYQLAWRFGTRRMDADYEYYPLSDYETQARYLERTGHLRTDEREHLAAHPELLQSDPDLGWSPELDAVLAQLNLT